MKESSRNWTYIIMGLFIVLTGFSLLIWERYTVYFLLYITAGLIGIYGVIQIIMTLLNYKDLKTRWDLVFQSIVGIVAIIFSLWLFSRTAISIQILSYIIGGYQVIMGVINLIAYILLRANDVPDRFFKIVYAVVHIVMGFITISVTLTNDTVLNLLSIYIIFIGFTYINDGRQAVIPQETSKKVKRRMRFPLPVIFQAFLPQRVIRKVNRFIEDELNIDEQIIKEKRELNQQIDPDHILKIHVSTGEEDLDRIGHTNFVYKDTVYTYGNHDIDSRHIAMLIGDGVLAICDLESYMAYTMSKGTTIIEYTIVLTDDQVNTLQSQLDGILNQLEPWEPVSEKQWDSHAGNLLHYTNTKLYKFTEGKYKTYFALGTNCVMLTDNFIGISGLDLFPMVGVLTPGTYYDYLDKEYEKENTIVINRTVYNQKLHDYLIEHTKNLSDLLE